MSDPSPRAPLPPAIYLLSLCSFAFGLTEFIATLLALGALACNLLGFYLLRAHAVAMLVLCGSLGLLFFAIVTLSTMRLLRLAQQHCPGMDAVAAGLNIAAFNAGTATGGVFGGVLIARFGLPVIALGGMGAALLALMLLWRTAGK